MPKLQITNVGLATVTVRDFEGYTNFGVDVATGTTETRDISRDLLQRLAPSLRAMETEVKDALGTVLVGIRWSVVASDDEDDRSMEEGLAGLPSLNELRLAGYSTGTPAADVVATGTGLLGNQTKATLRVANATGTVRLDLEAVVPGAGSNAISCEVITPASTLLVTVAGNKITVRPAVAGSTIANIAAAINAEADALLLVQASVGVAGTLTTAVAEAHLAGGVGPGVSLALNGTALAITALTDTQINFATPAGISAASRIIPLEFQNGPHKTRLSVPVIS